MLFAATQTLSNFGAANNAELPSAAAVAAASNAAIAAAASPAAAVPASPAPSLAGGLSNAANTNAGRMPSFEIQTCRVEKTALDT